MTTETKDLVHSDVQDSGAVNDPGCTWQFELEQNGHVVASGIGHREDMLREAAHYAMIYGQDGPVQAVVWRGGDERPPRAPGSGDRTNLATSGRSE
jgi:hypothetical protein